MHREGHLGRSVLHDGARGVAGQAGPGSVLRGEERDLQRALDDLPRGARSGRGSDDGHLRRRLGDVRQGEVSNTHHVALRSLVGAGREVPRELEVGAIHACLFERREDLGVEPVTNRHERGLLGGAVAKLGEARGRGRLFPRREPHVAEGHDIPCARAELGERAHRDDLAHLRLERIDAVRGQIRVVLDEGPGARIEQQRGRRDRGARARIAIHVREPTRGQLVSRERSHDRRREGKPVVARAPVHVDDGPRGGAELGPLRVPEAKPRRARGIGYTREVGRVREKTRLAPEERLAPVADRERRLRGTVGRGRAGSEGERGGRHQGEEPRPTRSARGHTRLSVAARSDEGKVGARGPETDEGRPRWPPLPGAFHFCNFMQMHVSAAASRRVAAVVHHVRSRRIT